MVKSLLSLWGDLVARYGFGQVLLAIVAALFVTAAVAMCVAGMLALVSLRREAPLQPRAPGPKSRRVS